MEWSMYKIALGLFLLTVFLFLFYPDLDLFVTRQFYDEESGFIYHNTPWVQFSYHLFARLHFYVFFGLIWLIYASWRWQKMAEKDLRRRLAYLLLVLILGPGLLVSVLKDHSGRARPSMVVELGGDRTFTPALIPAEQCARNCSFVSGHAAMGFWFIALAWVFRDRRWFWFGITVGALVGLGRILQGSHYLSDVIFSFWVVFGTSAIIARWFFGTHPFSRNELDKPKHQS
jgi:lipid A 4'-phosphatase